MIQFPYGIADFRRIRREGMVYVDRTAHVRDLETLGSVLVFLRPRRFGKSLWVQTLATYYDLRYADAFDEIFGGLDVGRKPTPLRNRYFILQWNFSLIKPRGDADEIAESLRRHVRSQAELFLLDYTGFVQAEIRSDAEVSEILTTLLGAVRRTGHPLYLLIDEYDNFVNEVMVRNVETYKALFEADGPYKELFKAVKNATEGLGLERVFVTGVSPVALNDLTSGFNSATDVSLKTSLAGLCGFGRAAASPSRREPAHRPGKARVPRPDGRRHRPRRGAHRRPRRDPDPAAARQLLPRRHGEADRQRSGSRRLVSLLHGLADPDHRARTSADSQPRRP